MQLRIALALWAVAATYSLGAPLTIRLGADMYQGGPRFVVDLDGQQVGEGTVSKADGEDFTFDIPEQASQLSISYTNDAAAPVDADGTRPPGNDRNLKIFSVGLGEKQWSGGDFSGDGTSRFGKDLRLNNNTTVSLDLNQDTGAVGSEADPQAQATACNLEFSVTGFSNGSVAVTAEQQGAVTAALDGQLSCKVRVTGFSSTSGSSSVNEKLASERAKAVVGLLVSLGIPDDKIDVVSGGETTRFGPDQASNRRVVISLD